MEEDASPETTCMGTPLEHTRSSSQIMLGQWGLQTQKSGPGVNLVYYPAAQQGQVDGSWKHTSSMGRQ